MTNAPSREVTNQRTTASLALSSGPHSAMLNLRLVFVALVWGINFSVIKIAIADFHPLGFTVIRFALAALFLVVVMLSNHEPFAIERRDIFAIVRLGFLGITLYNILFMYGLKL